MTDYLPRELAPRISRAMARLPVVVLSGLRQTGKSTLLQHVKPLAEGRRYYTLDDFATLAAARANPQGLLTQEAAIDEVQRCPGLLIEIKQAVDRDRRPGRFLLSGSANLALIGAVGETLAGRAVYLTLHPMTRREIRRATSRQPFLTRWIESRRLPEGGATPITDDEMLPEGDAEPITDDEILRGGLPPACLGPDNARDEWFRGYVQTYVERDVRQLAQIADLVAFQTFTLLAAMRTARVLAISDLARDARLSASTAGRYLHLLEASFLVRRLPPFLRNRSTRLIKSPRLFITDSGLAAHLAGVRDLSSSRDGIMRGALLETYVAQNLAAILEAHLPDASMTFWHEQGRHEVDFIIEHGARITAIEVKAASRWTDGDLAGLRAFMRRTPECASAILAYNGARAVALHDRLYAIPIGHLLG